MICENKYFSSISFLLISVSVSTPNPSSLAKSKIYNVLPIAICQVQSNTFRYILIASKVKLKSSYLVLFSSL